MLVSDEGQVFLVNQMFATMLGHLPQTVAAELEQAVDLGEVEFSEQLVAMTVTGELAFRALARTWHLAKNETGQSCVQVTRVDEDGTFASTLYMDRVEIGSLIDRLENVEFIDLELGPEDDAA